MSVALLSVIDTVACSLAATGDPGPLALARTVHTDDSLDCNVIGMGTKASVRDAALLNGMLAHMLDFDDGDFVGRGHPSCVLVPAILAVAEKHKLSGKAVLEAYLVGFYTFQVVGCVVGKTMAERGYHLTGMIGVLGAVAGICHLVNATADETATALGIAATTAMGLRANFGSDMKPYHAARAAACAVEGVSMAQAGLTACQEILEADGGFVSVIADPGLQAEIKVEVGRLLNGEYSIEKTRPLLKLYACCHSMHAHIAAILEMRPRLKDRLSDITKVIAEAPHNSKMYLVHSRPTNGLQGKFSMEAGVAIALLDGAGGVREYLDASIERASVQDLMRKVVFETSDRMEEIFRDKRMPGKVTIFTAKETFEKEIPDVKGCRTDPCTLEDISAKYLACAADALSPDAANRSLGLLKNLRDVADIQEITRLIRGGEIDREASPTGHATASAS